MAGRGGAIPARGKWRQENCEFKASLGYIEILSQKKKKVSIVSPGVEDL
jgi:hypothetical protein